MYLYGTFKKILLKENCFTEFWGFLIFLLKDNRPSCLISRMVRYQKDDWEFGIYCFILYISLYFKISFYLNYSLMGSELQPNIKSWF